MRLPTKTLAAALIAAAVPLYSGPAAAAPLSQSLALNSADVGAVEQVQYRRWNRGGNWNRGRWIGPAAGLAAGAIVGGAIAASRYNDGYYAYGAAPGYYAYGAAPGYVGLGYERPPYSNYGNGGAATGPGSAAICPPDRYQTSAYPSWMCR
jgi:hypothetical protein